jgi:hypothetical protein
MATQTQAVNVMVRQTFLHFARVDETPFVRARCDSDFCIDYANLNDTDFAKLCVPSTDCATTDGGDSDSDDSSSQGHDSDGSSSRGHDGDFSCTQDRRCEPRPCCPPGVHARPAVQACFFVPQIVAAPFPAQVSVHEARTQSKTEELLQDGTMTSLMLRNIPNNLKREALLELFDRLGFQGLYDFVYLPIDFSRKSNVGYSFVNLIDAAVASRFLATFQGFQGWTGSSRKVCEAVWTQPCQGLSGHVDRYRNSPVMHADVPDECRPVLFRNGERIAFPSPTKPLKRPKMRTVPAKKSDDRAPYWRQNEA